jgi:hypothetical protein
MPHSITNTQFNRSKKAKLSLRHEDIWGSGGIALPFLISKLDGGEWSATVPGRFIPEEIATGTH